MTPEPVVAPHTIPAPPVAYICPTCGRPTEDHLMYEHRVWYNHQIVDVCQECYDDHNIILGDIYTCSSCEYELEESDTCYIPDDVDDPHSGNCVCNECYGSIMADHQEYDDEHQEEQPYYDPTPDKDFQMDA